MPLPYLKISPEEKYLNPKNNPPDVKVTFFKDGPNIKNINCYSNEEDKWRKSKINFISDNEIKRILGQVSESAINQKTGLNFEIGEKVKVCDGPFASFTGLIEEIDEEKSRLKVSVSIFGRPTPVDLEFNQVEKN